jgi:1-acyl-sn-glycerol-3-phosphate acyltransferase
MGNFFYRIACGMMWIFFRVKYRVKVHNKQNRPHLKANGGRKRGYIIACNHQSYADPPAMGAVLRGRFAFMAKEELFANKLFAGIIRMCGAFPVKRGSGDGSAVEMSVAQLKKGRILVIFPEGTRSKDGTIGRAKSGVAMIAALANVPVLPVCIGYGIGKKRNFDFAVGKMIEPEEIALTADTDRKEIKRVAALIIDRIKELQNQIYESAGCDTLGAPKGSQNE